MTFIEVDHTHPIPEPANGPTMKYPWSRMSPGDSFFVPFDADDKGQGNRLRSAASTRKTRHGEQYTVRRVADGYRIWRME